MVTPLNVLGAWCCGRLLALTRLKEGLAASIGMQEQPVKRGAAPQLTFCFNASF